jgi:predicted metal-dependent HD superfamily phosphohydrolase
VILAAADEDYNRYTKQIRQEYIHVPLEAYQKGRAAVLQSFLQKEPFVTPLFNSIFGKKARENMTREIEWLPELKE